MCSSDLDLARYSGVRAVLSAELSAADFRSDRVLSVLRRDSVPRTGPRVGARHRQLSQLARSNRLFSSGVSTPMFSLSSADSASSRRPSLALDPVSSPGTAPRLPEAGDGQSYVPIPGRSLSRATAEDRLNNRISRRHLLQHFLGVQVGRHGSVFAKVAPWEVRLSSMGTRGTGRSSTG